MPSKNGTRSSSTRLDDLYRRLESRDAQFYEQRRLRVLERSRQSQREEAILDVPSIKRFAKIKSRMECAHQIDDHEAFNAAHEDFLHERERYFWGAVKSSRRQSEHGYQGGKISGEIRRRNANEGKLKLSKEMDNIRTRSPHLDDARVKGIAEKTLKQNSRTISRWLHEK